MSDEKKEQEIKVLAEFLECKVCGSTELVAGQLGVEMKAKNWMRPEFNQYTHIIQVIPNDPQNTAKIPIGSEIPARIVYADFCAGCGTYRVVKIYKAKAIKTDQRLASDPRFMGLPNLNS